MVQAEQRRSRKETLARARYLDELEVISQEYQREVMDARKKQEEATRMLRAKEDGD